MKIRWMVWILAATSCGTTRSDFLERMDSIEREGNALLEDIKKPNGQAAVQQRLKTIRQHVTTARTIRYRKPEEMEEMDPYFDTFLMKLDQLEQAEWTTGDGPRLWDKLQFQCSVCHGRFQEE